MLMYMVRNLLMTMYKLLMPTLAVCAVASVNANDRCNKIIT
jgi:hypothetical protein